MKKYSKDLWLLTELGTKFYKIIQHLPVRSFRKEVIESVEGLPLEEREQMLECIDYLIERLENQVTEWKDIKKIVSKKQSLRLVK